MNQRSAGVGIYLSVQSKFHQFIKLRQYSGASVHDAAPHFSWRRLAELHIVDRSCSSGKVVQALKLKQRRVTAKECRRRLCKSKRPTLELPESGPEGDVGIWKMSKRGDTGSQPGRSTRSAGLESGFQFPTASPLPSEPDSVATCKTTYSSGKVQSKTPNFNLQRRVFSCCLLFASQEARAKMNSTAPSPDCQCDTGHQSAGPVAGLRVAGKERGRGGFPSCRRRNPIGCPATA